MINKRGGFTLIEAVIALALFGVISLSALQIWRYASGTALRVADGADAFENARAAMDALLMNLALADEITLEKYENGMLERLTLRELDPDGSPHNYVIKYIINLHRLEFGSNEFASRLSEVRLLKSGELMFITISSDGEADERVVLQSATDIRYKTYHDS